MESNLSQRRRGLEEKIPDISKTLDMVRFLQSRRVSTVMLLRQGCTQTYQERKSRKNDDDDIDDLDEEDPSSKPLTTTFELNDTLYAHAELEDTETVYLWLGVSGIYVKPHNVFYSKHSQANTMLSYTISEAITLLSTKLSSAEQALKNTIEDLEFLREQVTVMEVNTARVYNWDVKRRRLRREKAVKSKEESQYLVVPQRATKLLLSDVCLQSNFTERNVLSSPQVHTKYLDIASYYTKSAN